MRVQTDKDILHNQCVVYEDNKKCISKIRQYLIINKGKAVGIAANQLFMKNRVFGIWYDNKMMIFVNPEIVRYSGDSLQDSTEGCMSIKGGKKHYHLKRPTIVVLKSEGREELTLTDYYATVICHEMDHLNGVLISDGGAHG